ncbi:laccase, multicopper oxidase, benzenediol:oxygen oxidorectuctase [Paramarasmius palmivorus]|uniref:Laccase, multicopper oxidase, benzenediol:oxygen oxidorectuctase n=1 Tax=Paramarasmius palmivorus TaxID=297713 RepID=A0AAW0BKG3_9AGAR
MARLQSLLSFVLLALSAGVHAAIGPEADLVISNGVVSPDGFSRSAVLAGGTAMGPLIVGSKGESLKINVVNQLNDNTMLQSTSIHWHGFFQTHTNWADGPAFVNQCPIPHGTSFLYDFPVREQAGTFWYHSHLSTQYCDGLRGPIVIYDPDDPYKDMYDVDDESTVITLADWYHEKAKTLLDPTPDSTLINGLGRYRMRLVNVACGPDYIFSIDNHEMTVIEADSINHEPVTVGGLRIFIGQRYSFILEANRPVGNYWIHADPSYGDNGFNGGINSAILRYVGAPETEPADDLVQSFVAAKKPDNMLNEADLHPLENPGTVGEPFPGGVDYAVNLHISTSSDHFAINGIEYESPTLPVLLQIMSGAQQAGDLLPTGSVYELPVNSSIEVSFTGGGVKGFEHPMHLHGHAFDVVRVAGSDTYNYANPVRRDVVSTGKGGDNVTFRFFTDNPGPWFLHCHIDWHLEVGLAVVFAEARDETSQWVEVPPAWDELCPAYEALAPGEL